MSSDEIRFTIPRSSYLGTLLSYLTPETLAKCGKSLFIGEIPELWHNDKKVALSKVLKQKSATRLHQTNDVVQQYLASDKGNPFFKRREEILQNIESINNNLSRILNESNSPDSSGVEIFSPINEGSGLDSLPTIHAPSSNVKFEVPHPQTSFLMDYTEIEEENRKFTKQLKKFTKKAAGDRKPTHKPNRIQESIIKSYNVGDIIRIDKVLVMAKQQFGDSQNIETRVIERWREFVLVVRKTDSHTEPFILQFYDINKLPTQSHPKFGFRINKELSVEFQSYLDKTISVTVSEKTKYVLRLNNQENALRWVFFTKEALGICLNRVFNIYVPARKIYLEVAVPELVLHSFFKKTHNLVIIKKEHGYDVILDELVQYLKDFIYRKVPEHPQNSWFCFRHYDRIEWTKNTAEMLYIQNSLFLPLYQLEYREVCAIDTEPIPVEGFLGRLTNTEGHERSGLRDFYKILYFFTNRNILFFTKYYRAILPPNVENTSALITEQNIFSSEHMAALLKNHSQHDSFAENEIRRKIELVVNAEGLIDVADIIDIRISNATTTQKLMQCTLWYSKPELVHADDITESCFEIVLRNGSVIKLQAPTRDARRVWMSRLGEISEYWSRRANIKLCDEINGKAENKRRLVINNYVDSNAPDEINFLESKNAVANSVGMYHLLPNTLVIKSGYLYQKNKKHSSFNKFYAVLCPGFLIIYHTFKRSKVNGTWKRSSYFTHYITIPLVECYLYSGRLAELDLLAPGIRNAQSDKLSVPRVHQDGWRSMEEDHLLCFTLWFGKKRNLTQYEKNLPADMEIAKQNQNNPSLLSMIRTLGVTGKSIIFTTKSRQERDHWISCILEDMDRFNL